MANFRVRALRHTSAVREIRGRSQAVAKSTRGCSPAEETEGEKRKEKRRKKREGERKKRTIAPTGAVAADSFVFRDYFVGN